MTSTRPRYIESFSGKLYYDEKSIQIAIKSTRYHDAPYMFVALTPHSVWALENICHDEKIPRTRYKLEELVNETPERTAIVECEVFGFLAFPEKYASKVIEAYSRWLAYNDYWYQMKIVRGNISSQYDAVMKKLWKLDDENDLPIIYDFLYKQYRENEQ